MPAAALMITVQAAAVKQIVTHFLCREYCYGCEIIVLKNGGYAMNVSDFESVLCTHI